MIDRKSVAGAAFAVQAFVLYLVVAFAIAPPTDEQWAHADPILRILPRAVSFWIVPLLGIALAIAWRARPNALALRDGALGAVLAVALVLLLRLVWGPSMPGFVPSEESARPGPALNMAAGLGEELIFRLGILSPLYFLLVARMRRAAAGALACVLTGLAFALLHHAGPVPDSIAWFATRTLMPGIAMSAVYLVRPSFLVCAHCAAHVVIPLVF